MAAKVMDLLRVGHRFTSFEEIEKLVLDLRQFGFPVRIASSCLVEDCNQVIGQPLDEQWKYSFIRFVCDQHLNVKNKANCSFSFEINYIDRMRGLVLTRANINHNSFESFISNQNGKLQLISNSLRVIRSRTGHVLALYRQSNAQRKLYQRHGDVLVIHLHYGCTFNSKKTLLAISVIDNEDGADYTVCLVTLPNHLLLKVIACCLEIFISSNDPSSVKSVVVNREELLPSARKAFPEADLLMSKGRMLQKVSAELSKHYLKPDLREQIYNTFAVCCSTSCEQEFGYAEAYLLSAGDGLGSYFETTWFEQTDIWRTIDNLRRIKKVDVEKAISNVHRKLAQTGFYDK